MEILTWINSLDSHRIRGIIIILACILAYQLLIPNVNYSLSVNSTPGSVADARKIEGEDLYNTIKDSPVGSKLWINWRIKNTDIIWGGNQNDGRFYSAIYIPGIDKPFLALLGHSTGTPQKQKLNEILSEQNFYLLVKKKSETYSQNILDVKNVEREIVQFIASSEEENVMEILQTHFNIMLDSSFLFELVAVNAVSQAGHIVLAQDPGKLMYWLLLGILVFTVYSFTYFTRFFFGHKHTLRSAQQGATLLEMTFVIAFISLIALASVESTGNSTKCSLYTSAGLISKTQPYPDLETAQKCCPNDVNFCFAVAPDPDPNNPPIGGCICGKLAQEGQGKQS